MRYEVRPPSGEKLPPLTLEELEGFTQYHVDAEVWDDPDDPSPYYCAAIFIDGRLVSTVAQFAAALSLVH